MKSEGDEVRDRVLRVVCSNRFGYALMKRTRKSWCLYDRNGIQVAQTNLQLIERVLANAEILKACEEEGILRCYLEECKKTSCDEPNRYKTRSVTSGVCISYKTRSVTSGVWTRSDTEKRKRYSSLSRPKFGKKGLEHVDVRVLEGKKSRDAMCRLLGDAQSYLSNVLEGLRGFAIHKDRERIKSLLSKYRTKQIVLIRPKVKSSANDNVAPDVELEGASGEALRHIVRKVKTRYKLESQGFELETVSWVFVPPCAPPQSFHQDYEPSSIPSVRDLNVEMGTILHLQAQSKSTEFIVVDCDTSKEYSLDTAQNVMSMIRQDKKGDVTFRSAVSREKVKRGTCVTFDTRWIHRGPSGIGYDETGDEAERSRLRRANLSDSKYWRIVLHMSWKKKKKTVIQQEKAVIMKTVKRSRGRPKKIRRVGSPIRSMGNMGNKIVFSPPNFLFSSEEESINWLKGRRRINK